MKELVKIVFQDGTPEEKQLSMTVYSEQTEEGETIIERVEMASMHILESTEPTLVSHIYLNLYKMLHKIQDVIEETKECQDVYILSREEYREYLVKVKGFNIPDYKE